MEQWGFIPVVHLLQVSEDNDTAPFDYLNHLKIALIYFDSV